MSDAGQRDDRNVGSSETKGAPTPHGFMALASGTRFARGYTIQSVIAAGGFGITYLGTHDALQRTCAIKEHFPRQFAYRDSASSDVRPTDPTTYSWALDRFIQEGRSLAKCSHPNVVSVADVFEANGTAYMVLNYEDGQSLKNWLDGLKRPPTQAEIDRLLAPLLDALDFVHGRGLLHRDIAPDNIMIRIDGTPCLIDFGAARQAIAERSQVMSAIVKTGYSPPEQYTTSGKAQGPWSDIYALGATIYRAITGRIPPEATERQIADELLPTAQAVASPEAYRPSFLTGIDAALRLKQAERPQTIAVWRVMLSAALSTPPTDGGASTTAETAAVREASFSGLPSQQSVTPKRRPGALASALAAILLAGGSGLAFQQFLPYQAPDVAEVARQTEQRRLAIVEAERLWPTVKDSTSIATLEAFVSLHRGTIHADLAQARLEEIKKQQSEQAKRKIDDEAHAKAEAERKRLAMLQEDQDRKLAEAEAKRGAAAEAERVRLAAENAEKERKRTEAELSRLRAEAAKRKTDDEVRDKAEAERGAAACVNIGSIKYCASSVLPTTGINTDHYGPRNLGDADPTTAWVENVPGDGDGEWITLSWRETRTVRGLRIVNGYAKSDRLFRGNGRVARLRITAAGGQSAVIAVGDTVRPQLIDLPSPMRTNWLRVEIVATIRGERHLDTAMSELQVAFE